MNTDLIVIKTQPGTKAKAKEIANEFGLSLSALINLLLKQLIRDKSVTIHLEEEPSQYMLDSLKKSEEDVKAGRVVAFESGKDALSHLNSLIEHERRQTSTY